MAAVAAPAEERVILHDVSWQTYQRLLAEHVNSAGTRFAYNKGELEIMVVYAGHEEPNRTLAALVEELAVALDKDCYRSGSTTFRREDLDKGFEPDSSFYFDRADAVRGKKEIDLHADPPPELSIEVDVTRSPLNKFPIFAAIGIREVWRYSEGKVSMYALHGTGYEPIQTSLVLAPMTAEAATRLLHEGQRLKPRAWRKRIQEWIQENVSG